MKKCSILTLVVVLLIGLSSCVTKQKYQELESQYQNCNKDLVAMTAEKMDFENSSKELKTEVDLLKSQIEKLKGDTLSISRKLKQSERDYAKARKDYDDLLNDFSELNKNNNAEINSLLADVDKMKQQLNEREKELDAKSAELAEKEQRLNELQRILDQKDAEVRSLKEKVANALKGFEDSGLNVYEKNGKVYVSLNDKLLFASAKWEVEAAGDEALKEVAKILENDTTINVLIEGHTDNVPFKGQGQVKDNWDLSVMRATSVVKSLLKHGDIAPERISASGRGEYFPIDTEDTPEARAKNRRTEIILTPKLDELFQIINNN
ncbi:MAG: OmpA family protein [Bacteroidales bacterium]|nr:OmpA family protein [Bacteroidales bacterium]